MPNKRINHSILKLYDNRNIREPIKYYQPKMEKELVMKAEKIGRGIKIGNLMDFNANTDIDKTMRPIDKAISEVNDKFQPFAPVGHQEVSKSTFIFNQTGQRKDAAEITQN